MLHGSETVSSVVVQGRSGERKVFPFDVVFEESASQDDVFEGFGHGLADHLLEGFNGCLFMCAGLECCVGVGG